MASPYCAYPANLSAKLPAAVQSSRRQQARHTPSRTAAIHAAARRRRHIVATCIASVEMAEHPAASDPASIRVRFPATLARPVFKDIDFDALAAVDADLAATPLEYIHEKLRAAGPRCVSSPCLKCNVLTRSPACLLLLRQPSQHRPADLGRSSMS